MDDETANIKLILESNESDIDLPKNDECNITSDIQKSLDCREIESSTSNALHSNINDKDQVFSCGDNQGNKSLNNVENEDENLDGGDNINEIQNASKVLNINESFSHSTSKDERDLDRSLIDKEVKNNDITNQSLNNSKESEVENVDAIKKFIEDQEQDIINQQKENRERITVPNTECLIKIEPNEKLDDENILPTNFDEASPQETNALLAEHQDKHNQTSNVSQDEAYEKEEKLLEFDVQSTEKNCKNSEPKQEENTLANEQNNIPEVGEGEISENEECKNKIDDVTKHDIQIATKDDKILTPTQEESAETMDIASHLMDIILNQSENVISEKEDVNILSKNDLQTDEKGTNSLAIKVGSEVEAKDFDEYWYPAKIVEVDYDELEVLIHYENSSKKT